jgi:magnesium transporter
MQLRLIDEAGVVEYPVTAAADLLNRADGVLWLDVPAWDEQAERLLRDVFGFHPLAIQDSAQRNHVPKTHVYRDHVFLVLHAPQTGAAGHVHYIELDQFIGDRYLVTIHGPLNPAADPAAARVEVDAVVKRLESGRLRPAHGYQLSSALASALAVRMSDFTAQLTVDTWNLEYRLQDVVRRVTSEHDPEQFLDRLFRTRHGLIAVKTMAGLSREVFARMHKIEAFGPGGGQERIDDAVDQFDRLCAMADGQKDYLEGTIEFYQARTNTKVTIAAERLAVIAAVTLPVTAISSILGMNVIVNDATQPVALTIAVLIMGIISMFLLIWCRRRGWW